MDVITSGTVLEVPPAAEPTWESPRALQADRAKSRRHQTADGWLIAVMVACSCLFAIAVAAYILHPAQTTVSAASTDNWSAGGP